MSISYYMYTEVNINGKWICINNRIKNIKKDMEMLSETYYSGSRSYFGEAAEKIKDIGLRINHEDMSEALKSIFKDEEYFFAVSVSPKRMRDCFPEDKTLKEFCGYVLKDTLFRFQTGEIEDICSWLSIDEYLALSEEEKVFYKFYEWNSEDGWYIHFQEILEHFNWQRYEWGLVNWNDENDYEFRLVLIIQH